MIVEAENAKAVLGLAIMMSTFLYMQNKIKFEPRIDFLDILAILSFFALGYLNFKLIIQNFQLFCLAGFTFPFTTYFGIYWYYKIRHSSPD